MRTRRERVVHTALFEVLAVLIVAPAMAWVTDAPLADAGMLSLLVSLGAVLANYVWTMLFDRIVPTRRRGIWLRAVQAAGLELIVSSFTIPLVMMFTGVSLGAAVLFDMSGIAFFVVFAMIYNATFDAVMIRLIARPV